MMPAATNDQRPRFPQPLQRLNVADCFAQFIWEGKQAEVIETAARPFTWQTATVEDLFRRYNWSGRTKPEMIAPIDPETATVRSLSVTWPVEQFFDCFVWAGQPEIAPLPAPPRSLDAAAPRSLKLDNFSKLF